MNDRRVQIATFDTADYGAGVSRDGAANWRAFERATRAAIAAGAGFIVFVPGAAYDPPMPLS